MNIHFEIVWKLNKQNLHRLSPSNPNIHRLTHLKCRTFQTIAKDYNQISNFMINTSTCLSYSNPSYKFKYLFNIRWQYTCSGSKNFNKTHNLIYIFFQIISVNLFNNSWCHRSTETFINFNFFSIIPKSLMAFKNLSTWHTIITKHFS